ncbi:unnamed protein product, partial [Ascophyllum nodosum]
MSTLDLSSSLQRNHGTPISGITIASNPTSGVQVDRVRRSPGRSGVQVHGVRRSRHMKWRNYAALLEIGASPIEVDAPPSHSLFVSS